MTITIPITTGRGISPEAIAAINTLTQAINTQVLANPAITGAATVSGSVTSPVITTSSVTDSGRVLANDQHGSNAFTDAAQSRPSKTYFVPVAAKVVSLDPATAGDYHAAITGPLHNVVQEPAGVLATETFTFPATALDGQVVTITSTQAITAATFNGGTFIGAPSALTANVPVRFVYIADTGKWYQA